MTPSSAPARTPLPTVSLTIARPDRSVTPLPRSVASVRAKRATSTFVTRSPMSGRRSRRASKREARRRVARACAGPTRRARPRAAATAHHQWRSPVPRTMTTCVAQRQRLARLRERLLELRHHPHQQHHDRQHGDADQDARIDERRLHALAELLVALHRVGEARQHDAERAARLARAHDVDVEAREHVAPRVERLRQRLAAAHVVADLLQERRGRRRHGEADQDLERAVERQARLQQRRRARA